VAVRRDMEEPALRLIAAAPLAPYVAPFAETARRGTGFLAFLAGGGLLAAVLLTGRLTASLERLADAATGVARGELTRRVEVGSQDEVGRVARAFNTMTENLRRTLDQLAERESLAAVNEFAAALAHEVRNPLTAIQLDLQEVEEQLPPGEARALQERALKELRHLDRTVEGALRTARSGRVRLEPLDVRAPVDAALHAARPALDARGARIGWERPEQPVTVRGDGDALERLLLNLLLNAADAIDAGGTVEVSVAAGEGAVAIRVRDDGRGIPPEQVARVFEPFFSTRPGGTGVGLAVARRIAAAHGGELRLESTPGAGTTVELALSALPESPRAGTT